MEITPDPKRTEAIRNIEAPRNRTELMSFMGDASQLAKWTPRYSYHREGLAHLCKKDSAWIWDERAESAFQEFKGFLADPAKLSVFDQELETVMVLDGSNMMGLGYALTQMDARPGHKGERHIISFGSSKLKTSQQLWSPCEVESL